MTHKKVCLQQAAIKPRVQYSDVTFVQFIRGYIGFVFTFRLFVIPRELPCTWGGLAYLGCSSATSCRSWVRNLYATVTSHELGHVTGVHETCSWCSVLLFLVLRACGELGVLPCIINTGILFKLEILKGFGCK